MILTITDLEGQLKGYYQQLEKHQICINQCSGAIQAIEHQIKLVKENALKIAEQLNANTEKGNQNAIEEGRQQENDSIEHQDGNSSGEETEPSDSDSLLESGQV